MPLDLDTPSWALPGTVRERADGSVAILCGRCADCGQLVFPKPQICSACLSERIGDNELDEGGRLYSYAVVHAARPGWQAPYAIAYVDFPGGVRVCGPLQLDGDARSPLDVPVRVVAGPLRLDQKGRTWLSHRFVVAGGRA